jgi:hypothetical protein
MFRSGKVVLDPEVILVYPFAPILFLDVGSPLPNISKRRMRQDVFCTYHRKGWLVYEYLQAIM